jgi:hypothetical protein
MNSGPLRLALEAAVEAEGWRLQDLTVLARQNDPFLQDTPAGHRDGQWFAEQVARFVLEPIHLRGLHYRIVAAADVLKPNGKPYTNTDEDWIWLQNKPAKAGRWLGYVSFDRVVDERNAEPEVTVFDRVYGSPYTNVSGGFCAIEVPSEESVLPTVHCSPLAARQPYRIILIGEKTSLGPVLRQVRGSHELLLPTGEISDTLIHGMAERAEADGRPAVVFYASDFDPSGHQMPISVSRKLQALKLLEFPKLSIEVHHVALTLEQVVALDLPSTPLKETERRADRWREVMGREQTEIDALAALRPEVLLQIVRDAVAPFRDATLERRAAVARAEWTRQAEEALRAHPAYDPACQAILTALADVEEAVGRLRDAQAQAERDLAIALPKAVTIPPQISGDQPPPLFTSDNDFAAASRRLINHKKLNGSEPI